MKNIKFYEGSKKKLAKLALSLLLIAPGLTGCSTNNEKKEEVNDTFYIVEESEKTPLQLKMDSYEDYQEIDLNEEVDQKYLEQMKNQIVVNQFHIYTQFDDFGYINFPEPIEKVQKDWYGGGRTVEYVKTLIVPTCFIRDDNDGVWTKLYDNNQIVMGEKYLKACPPEWTYTSDKELEEIFQNTEKEPEKQYRLNQNQTVQNKK